MHVYLDFFYGIRIMMFYLPPSFTYFSRPLRSRVLDKYYAWHGFKNITRPGASSHRNIRDERLLIKLVKKVSKSNPNQMCEFHSAVFKLRGLCIPPFSDLCIRVRSRFTCVGGTGLNESGPHSEEEMRSVEGSVIKNSAVIKVQNLSTLL